MAFACAVASCGNSGLKKDEGGLKFYRFPKDPNLFSKWQEFCKRTDILNWKNAVICSSHFTPEDQQKPLAEEILNDSPSRKRKLKVNAVPTLNYDPEIPQMSVSSYDVNKQDMSKRQCVDGELLNENDECSTTDTEEENGLLAFKNVLEASVVARATKAGDTLKELAGLGKEIEVHEGKNSGEKEIETPFALEEVRGHAAAPMRVLQELHGTSLLQEDETVEDSGGTLLSSECEQVNATKDDAEESDKVKEESKQESCRNIDNIKEESKGVETSNEGVSEQEVSSAGTCREGGETIEWELIKKRIDGLEKMLVAMRKEKETLQKNLHAANRLLEELQEGDSDPEDLV